ncbi:MAG: diguanylate cyclase domain-containing protein [Janthinobacterium lividum]
MSLFRRLFPPAPPAIEIELTIQLLGGGASIRMLGIVTAVIGVQAALNSDPSSASLLFAIALIALARIGWLRGLGRRYGMRPADLVTARRWQWRYGLGSFVSSLLVGFANLDALSYRDTPLALLIVCALCCYIFSVILRTAVRPIVCLSSVAVTLVPTLSGLTLFVDNGSRLNPTFAFAALATVAAVLVLSCVQLSAHLYRTTLSQLMAQRDLVRFARQDPLTGLNNRLALRERFEDFTPGPTRLIALLYLDLDGFKPVNDAHGHQAGDALLCAVATRLTACLRPGEGAYRIGGDEFVVLSRVRQPSDATAMAQRLLVSLSEPYSLRSVTICVGVSIGIALADVGDADLDDLTATADAALYEAKRSGRGTFRFAKHPSSLQSIA